jgi:glycosyltransferase involved in cell wall biosynthesis
MRIAIITPNFPPENVTGAEKFSFELSKILAKRNQILILTNKSQKFKGLECKNMHLENSKLKRKLYYDYFNNKAEKHILNELKIFRPNIVHINNFYGLGSGTIKKISEKHPTIMTLHDYFLLCYSATLSKENTQNKKPCICYPPLGWIHKNLMHHHLKNMCLISPSIFLARKMEENGFFNVKVIPNGITTPKNSTTYKKNILFVGRLSKEKGLQTIINTLNQIKEYDVLVLGDGPLKEKLESQYRNIKFLGFQDPKNYYNNASISIVPSIWMENFSYSVLEAMSYGLTVIGSNIGGIPEQITHMKTGLLFKPGNKKDFAKKLDYLIKNPSEIKRIGKNARKVVKEKFGWNKVIEAYEEIYTSRIKSLKGKK